jgi:type IV secretion system protein TrbL
MADPSTVALCAHQLSCHPSVRIEAFSLGSLNPLSWLGSAASQAVGDVWKAAMIALWSAGLWLLSLAFTIIDSFTTPDLTAGGPIGSVLPTTLWIGATVAVLMMFVQLAVALIRRDGQSIGRVVFGVVQFGAVWLIYLGVAAGLVAAAAGLEKGILESTLQVHSLSAATVTRSWPRNVTDTTLATVLGVLSLLLVIPAAFFYLIIMFVRAAALIILVATAPISAAGLVNDTTKVWFWKSLRWFIACLLIAPMTALVLGIGTQLSAGIVAGNGDQTAAAAGMAVVGTVMIAIGAVCPLVLFRLLAFVEPGTASGAALRQSWSDAGGMPGVLSVGASSPVGCSAATQTGSDGRSGGEAGAESATQSRMAAAFGAAGGAMQTATSVAHRAVDIASDVLGQSGVGAPSYAMTPTDQRASYGSPRGSTSGEGGSGGSGSEGDGGHPPHRFRQSRPHRRVRRCRQVAGESPAAREARVAVPLPVAARKQRPRRWHCDRPGRPDPLRVLVAGGPRLVPGARSRGVDHDRARRFAATHVRRRPSVAARAGLDPVVGDAGRGGRGTDPWPVRRPVGHRCPVPVLRGCHGLERLAVRGCCRHRGGP